MQTRLITEKQAQKWLAHYKGLMVLALHTGHPTAVEECEEHIAMIALAIEHMREEAAHVKPS